MHHLLLYYYITGHLCCTFLSNPLLKHSALLISPFWEMLVLQTICLFKSLAEKNKLRVTVQLKEEHISWLLKAQLVVALQVIHQHSRLVREVCLISRAARCTLSANMRANTPALRLSVIYIHLTQREAALEALLINYRETQAAWSRGRGDDKRL